jgi:hypothetical protein
MVRTTDCDRLPAREPAVAAGLAREIDESKPIE